jgi:hypothetical protein
MRNTAIEAIDALKPYRGGNDVLWHLHELNNTDKHRLVLTVGAMLRDVDLRPIVEDEAAIIRAEHGLPATAPVEVTLDLLRQAKTIPLKEGQIVLVEMNPRSQPNPNLKFTAHVAISEPGIVDGVPILDVLHHMAKVVSDIVSGFVAHLR